MIESTVQRILFVLALLALSRVGALAETTSLRVVPTETALEIAASEVDGDVVLIRCHSWEYYPGTSFLREYDGLGDDCQTDGYDQDLPLYSPDAVSALVEKRVQKGEREFSIERFSSFDDDRGRDKVYDRFYLVEGASVDPATGFATGGTIVAGPIFPTAPPAKSDAPRVSAKSIKGLEAIDLDDAKELGCAQAAMTVDLCWLVQSEGVETIEFPYCGKTFQFNKKAVDYYDAWVKKATDYEMEITFVLVFWGHRRHLAPEGWIFPYFEVWSEGSYALSIAAPNTTCRDGIERLEALYEFLGERYASGAEGCGRVANYVIGNELNSGYIWNNTGRLPLDETVRQYERYLRLAHTALRKGWSGANVLSSFDNFWTKNSAAEFGQTRYVDKGGFSGKEYLEALNRATKAEGDYPWSVAYHPYGLDLRTPVFWDQYSTEQAAKDESAPRITPYNCEILAQFLAKPENRFVDPATVESRPRDIYFTEQGFASPHDDNYGEYDDSNYDPDALPQVWLDRQCAALALGYYKAKAIGAKAYLVHRQFDVRSEGLNIGLRARPKGKEMGLGNKKPAWELYRTIDDPESKKENERYLPILRFYPNEEPPKSWSELGCGD